MEGQQGAEVPPPITQQTIGKVYDAATTLTAKWPKLDFPVRVADYEAGDGSVFNIATVEDPRKEPEGPIATITSNKPKGGRAIVYSLYQTPDGQRRIERTPQLKLPNRAEPPSMQSDLAQDLTDNDENRAIEQMKGPVTEAEAEALLQELETFKSAPIPDFPKF